MKFKVGDRIEIIGIHYLQGMLGTVVQDCRVSNGCKRIELVNGNIRHVLTSNLTLRPQKNQQLLFDFME